MKKQIIFIFMFSISILLFSDDNDARILFVNLYNENVDIRLGEENDPVFMKNNLAPYTSTVLARTNKFGDYNLYFKESVNDEYIIWTIDEKNPEPCSIREGLGLCIIATTDGLIKLFYIELSMGEGPKISFLNGYNSEVIRMEISKEWNKEVVAYTENLTENSVTNFVEFNSGKYSLFWHMPEQVNIKQYYFIPDEDGEKPVIYDFENNNYYIFLVFSFNNKHYSNIINISIPE